MHAKLAASGLRSLPAAGWRCCQVDHSDCRWAQPPQVAPGWRPLISGGRGTQLELYSSNKMGPLLEGVRR